MARRHVEQAVRGIGGIVPTAYFMGVTSQTVYDWIKAGGLRLLRRALQLQQLAAKHGVHLELADLAVPESTPTKERKAS